MASESIDSGSLSSAFAALERSRERVQAPVGEHVEPVIDTLATPTISELISSLRSGKPLTEAERRTAADYFNSLARSAQDQNVRHSLLADPPDE